MESPGPSPYVLRQEQIRYTRMPGKWKAALWILHLYANEKHTCTCSERTVAKESGFSRSVIQRQLAMLAEAGVITRKPRWKETADGYERESDRITINLRSLAKFNYAKWYARRPKLPGPAVANKVAQGVAQRGARVARREGRNSTTTPALKLVHPETL